MWGRPTDCIPKPVDSLVEADKNGFPHQNAADFQVCQWILGSWIRLKITNLKPFRHGWKEGSPMVLFWWVNGKGALK